MSSSTVAEGWSAVRGRGKQAVARLARKILPSRNLTLSHVEPGVKLTVNLRRHVMFWSGGLDRFEPYTVSVFRAAVEPGDTVFDVGANIGFFSTLLSRWVGPTGRVFAFEPEPRNLAMLRENLASNGCDNVNVRPCALGETPGVATFSLDHATGSTGRLGSDRTAGEIAVGSSRLALIETPVATIDQLAESEGIIPDLIKMDIEGGEIHALAGARNLLSTRRPVVLSELAGDEGPSVVEFLDALGYRLWDLETTCPVSPGERAFMVVGIPAESLDSPRAARIFAALKELGQGRFEMPETSAGSRSS